MAPTTDYRFTLANERTMLAWNRTALALVAGAVAVDQYAPDLGRAGMGHLVALVALALAGLLAVGSYLRWRRVQRVMAAGGELPANLSVALLAAGTLLLAAVVFVGVLL